MQLTDDIKDVIDQWCPERYKDSPNAVRMAAALLEANAYVMVLREVSAGRDPIRPLDSFKPFEDKQFTFYWLGGKKNVYPGKTPEDAFSRAGYGAGALAAVDFYKEGSDEDYIWIKPEGQSGRWEHK